MIKRFAVWLGRKYGMVSSEQFDRMDEQFDKAIAKVIQLIDKRDSVAKDRDNWKLAHSVASDRALAAEDALRKSAVEAPVGVMQIDAALGAFRSGELPDRFEIAAPADAEYEDAAGFIEKVNELKRQLGTQGWHVRIFSRTENVWLFRNLPKKRGATADLRLGE